MSLWQRFHLSTLKPPKIQRNVCGRSFTFSIMRHLPNSVSRATALRQRRWKPTPCVTTARSASTSTAPLDQLYCERRLLGYSCKQMFSVVSDVGSYNTFVPWCKKSDVVSRELCGLQASLVIGFPPFSESYTSYVTLFEPYLVTAVCTEMTLFHHLKNVWKFSEGLPDNPNTCTLDFAVSFRFRHSAHAYFSKLFFDEVVKQNVNAFLGETEKRFGQACIPPQKPIIVEKK